MAKARTVRRISFIHVPQDALVYELLCLEPSVHIDADGVLSPQYVTVYPFCREGRKRRPLPVNSDPGAEHYVFFRLATGSAVQCKPAVNVSSGMMQAPGTSGRFDLVAKSDVTVATANGRTTYTYSDMSVIASQQLTVSRDGEDGLVAEHSFTSVVFFRSETQPATPSGGTYADPIPTSPAGWTDAPDSSPVPLWMSRARFVSSSSAAPVWSTPSPVEDSTGIEFVFSASEADPGPPADTHPYPASGAGAWSKDPSGAVWMAVAVKNNGAWSPWSCSRIKGEKGESVVFARLDPQVVEMKAGAYRAYVDVYDGGLPVPASEVSYPVLTAGGPGWLTPNVLRWNFSTEGNRFYYSFTYFPTAKVDTDLNIEVTYRGRKYPVTIPLRSLADGEDGADGKDGNDGEDGADAVMYRLALTPSQLTYDLNARKYDSTEVRATVSKIVGKAETAVTGLAAEGLSLSIDKYVNGAYHSSVAVPDGKVTFGDALYSRIDFVLKKGTVSVASLTLGITCTGRNGVDGRNGVWVPPPMLFVDYPVGYTFQCGDLAKSPMDIRLDIVVIRTASGSLLPYRCILGYVKAANSPTPDKDPTHWQECDAGVYKFVATELLLAFNARIEFLSGQAIRVGEGDEMCGYFGAPVSENNGAVLFLGGDNVSEATFVVYRDGRVVARSADIEGRVSASVLDLKVSSPASLLPDGSLCFDVSAVRLPELEEGRVRMLRILNPYITRATPEDLSLIPHTANVGVYAGLRFDHGSSQTLTLSQCGRNGAAYIELMGYYNPITGFTQWGVVRNDRIE